jgi:hypothetical protein
MIMFEVKRYGNRYWQVLDPAGELVAVVLFKKGAMEVKRRLEGAQEKWKLERKSSRLRAG